MVKFVVASALLAAGVSSASQDLPDEGHATGWPPAWVSTPEFQDFLACTGTEDEWNAELLFPIRPVAPEDDDGGEGSSECVVMGAMPVEGITDDCCSSLNTAANAAVAGGDISTWLSADSCTGACGAAFSNVISVAANMGLVPAGSGAAWDGGCASFQPNTPEPTGPPTCLVMGAMPVEGITDDCCSSLNTAANAAVAGGDISTWLSADSCTGACGAAFSNVISVAANMGLVPAGSGAAWDGGCASFQPIEYCSIMGGQMSLEGIGLEAGACCQQLDVSLLLFCFVSFSLPPPK